MPTLIINGAAVAGSRHIEDATPTLAEALLEQIVWGFSSLDAVLQASVSLNTPNLIVTGLSSAAVEAIKTHEVQRLLVTINAGDDVTAATRLLNGFPEVFEVLPGETITISSTVAITTIHALAKLTTLAGVIQGGSTVTCIGASYA